jgi:hypothetical protein
MDRSFSYRQFTSSVQKEAENKKGSNEQIFGVRQFWPISILHSCLIGIEISQSPEVTKKKLDRFASSARSHGAAT